MLLIYQVPNNTKKLQVAPQTQISYQNNQIKTAALQAAPLRHHNLNIKLSPCHLTRKFSSTIRKLIPNIVLIVHIQVNKIITRLKCFLINQTQTSQ